MYKRLVTLVLGALVISCLGGMVNAAGPVREFETTFQGAYGDYRVALFSTNGKDAEAAMTALTAFAGKWEGIVARWGTAPPPQYADDPAWPALMESANGIIARARTAIRDGNLPLAHEILEAFRDEIGSLHARNGVATFSDRMNAYHSVMERILGTSHAGADAAARQALAGDVAVLEYLASDLGRHAPPALAASVEFKALLGALQASVTSLRKALALADAEDVRKAIGGPKPAYARFFLKFG